MTLFLTGFVVALVVVQCYPKSALVGVWLKEKLWSLLDKGLF